MRISAEEQGILFESLPLSGVQVEASEFDESSVVLIYSETEPEAVTATVIPQRRTIKTPVLPSRCASVRTVQKYLMSTLMVHHNVEFESANKMATKWNLGRGHSLRGLSAEKFTEDFGKIRGPHLHWAVQEDLQMEQELNDQKIIQEWQETKEFLIWRALSIASFVVAIVVFFLTKTFAPPAAILAMPQACFFHTLPPHNAKIALGILIFLLLLIVVCGVVTE